ncbi:MAG TPA: DegT/DnrJ/EryC1/StrS family aminotransferase [Solirubrobacteraceae bacterium]|nr:DegT/DnrJ/EryC1/StrS family aminotransferase [Solirubrobacteraceae bacterium]
MSTRAAGRTSAETPRAGAGAGEIPFFAAQREFAAHGRQLLERASAVLADGQTLQGQQVRGFEHELAQRLGRAHAVAVGSGTDALFFALRALRIGAGHQVLVPALSFIASASCVLRAGAQPVFIDTDDRHLLQLHSAHSHITQKTRAVIAVDLFGQTPHVEQLNAFAREHALLVIEDAAQALGAPRAGAIGHVSCVSFDPTKPLAAPGSGGALLTDDAQLAQRVRRLRWHGRDDAGQFADLGYNSQLPELSAAMLRHKLQLEPRWRAARQSVAARYDAALEAVPGVQAPVRDELAAHSFSKYVLRTPQREQLRALLGHAGVPTRVHYPRPLHLEPVFANAHGSADRDALSRDDARDGACPNAELAAREVLSLPIHAFLSDHEVQRVVDALTGAAVTLARG